MNKYIKNLKCNNNTYQIIDLNLIAKNYHFDLNKLPNSLKILLENIVRNTKENDLLDKIINKFKEFTLTGKTKGEFEFMPTRILMQDFTGVPALIDLASLRDAIKEKNYDVNKINPVIPVDLIIDHSIQVESFGSKNSLEQNTKAEIRNNIERYEFLKWAEKTFTNLKIVPPGKGICHQINLEYLANIVNITNNMLVPDTLIGTDSHTTMINGLSVIGWGVGGIEAVSAMVGHPILCTFPEIIGIKITGKLNEGVTATDLILHITHILRKENVTRKFVEYFGPSVKYLSLADRATITNMTPEYGATCSFFSTDEETIKYLELTNRSTEQINIIKEYTKYQKLWGDNQNPTFTKTIEINLDLIETLIAGPKRPQDNDILTNIAQNFRNYLKNDHNITVSNRYQELTHGSIVIAAITSCTNTSNPTVMIAAGLLAKKAIEFGLKTKDWVKTSLAPGSQVVTEYLKKSGLDKYLDQLGFNIVAYGCTTCIGNSGPLNNKVTKIIEDQNLIVTSILSGNRNFEGRIHPITQTNYLASPPLIVLYAILGNIMINPKKEIIGISKTGKEIYLKDLWPKQQEIDKIMNQYVTKEDFKNKYQDLYNGNKEWNNIIIPKTLTYEWQPKSTYIKPFPLNEQKNLSLLPNQYSIYSARILGIFGDSTTTDHISPAGKITPNTSAGKYLHSLNIPIEKFNSYGTRRGNHEIMTRGTFGNIRIKNKILKNTEGGFTKHYPSEKIMTIYDAAVQYNKEKINMIIFAGKEYGTGSSRDWAAKGTKLLGVKAIIAESFETIHRTNLICMGVLPLIMVNTNLKELELTGNEIVNIKISDISKTIQCNIISSNQNSKNIDLKLDLRSHKELDYLSNGGILLQILNNIDS